MAYPTDRTLYFRTDSTAGSQDGTADTAGNSGTAAFESLKAAVDYVITTDADLTGQGPLFLVCTTAGVDSPAATVSLSGIITTAADYLSIECTGDAHHAGVSRENSGTGYQLKRAGQTFANTANYLRVKGMELTTSGSTSFVVLDTASGGSSSDIRWEQCLFTATSASYFNSYIYEVPAGETFTFINCLFICRSGRGPHTNNAGLLTMDHCGVIGSGSYGLLPTANTTITNSWSVGTGTQDFWTSGGGHSGDYNASEDATANTIGYTNNIINMTLADEFNGITTDPATCDATLKAGSQLIGAGTGSRSTDITGATRTGTADIGPFDYAAAASSALPLLNSYYHG